MEEITTQGLLPAEHCALLEPRGRAAAAAMGADPEDAIAPADEGPVGRAGARLGAVVGTVGEAIDASPVGRLARRRAT
jgi:hypothetical protein